MYRDLRFSISCRDCYEQPIDPEKSIRRNAFGCQWSNQSVANFHTKGGPKNYSRRTFWDYMGNWIINERLAGGRGVQPRCPFTTNCLIFKNFLSLQKQAENPATQNSHIIINKPLRLIRIEKGGEWDSFPNLIDTLFLSYPSLPLSLPVPAWWLFNLRDRVHLLSVWFPEGYIGKYI